MQAQVNNLCSKSDSDTSTTDYQPTLPVINPGSGLPMIDNDYGGVDVGGNPYGSQFFPQPYSPPPPPFDNNSWNF